MAYKWKTIKPTGMCYDTEQKLPYSRFKWIVIHYTAVDGDTAEREGMAFSHNNERYAGAHCFVDNHMVVKSVPLNRAAWAVGGNKYPDCQQTGGGRYYGQCNNYNSISIEMCDEVKDGKHNVSQATLNNTIKLTKYYMKKYHVDADHVIRHWDITGKSCPAFWASKNSQGWAEFKRRIGGG